MVLLIVLTLKLFWLFEMAMVLRVLLSWLQAFGAAEQRGSSFTSALYWLTDPFFVPASAIYERVLSMFGIDARRLPLDLSPLVAFAIFYLVEWAVIGLLSAILL